MAEGRRNKPAGRKSTAPNIGAIVFSFVVIAVIWLVKPYIPGGERAFETDGLKNSKSSSINNTVYPKGTLERTVSDGVKSLLMATGQFQAVEVMPKLSVDQTRIDELNHEYSTAEGREEGYLGNSDTFSQETESSVTSQAENHYLPNEKLTLTQIPGGLIIPESSSVAVTAVIQGDDGSTGEGALPAVDPELYTTVSAATGIPSANITITAYYGEAFNGPFSETGEGYAVDIMVYGITALFVLHIVLQLIFMARKEKYNRQPAVKKNLQAVEKDGAAAQKKASPAPIQPKEDEKLKRLRAYVEKNPGKSAGSIKKWMD